MYDVFEESKNAVLNLEDNAWANHKDEYIQTKGQVENFKDRIKYEQIKLHEATTEEERNISQDELTKIIDEILSVNDNFNSSLMEVDNVNPLLEVNDDDFKLDTQAIDAFLANSED